MDSLKGEQTENQSDPRPMGGSMPPDPCLVRFLSFVAFSEGSPAFADWFACIPRHHFDTYPSGSGFVWHVVKHNKHLLIIVVANVKACEAPVTNQHEPWSNGNLSQEDLLASFATSRRSWAAGQTSCRQYA